MIDAAESSDQRPTVIDAAEKADQSSTVIGAAESSDQRPNSALEDKGEAICLDKPRQEIATEVNSFEEEKKEGSEESENSENDQI